MRDAFHGTGSLVASRGRTLRAVVSVALVGGVVVGLGARLVRADLGDLEVLLLALSAFQGIFLPLLVGLNLTLATGAVVGTNRREELSLLPVGRLALPAAVLLASGLACLGGSLAWALGLSVGVGPLQALADPRWWRAIGLALAGTTALGVPLASVAAVGSRSGLLLFFTYALPCVAGVGLLVMGHEPDLAGGVGAALVGVTFLVGLGVPFLVHALGPHVASTAKGAGAPESAEEAYALGGAVVLCAAALVGLHPLVVGGAALLVWQARRLRRQAPRPARRPWRAVPATLAVVAPLWLVSVGAVVAGDALVQARADRGEDLRARLEPALSPDGRHAALDCEVALGPGLRARRVVVAALAGGGPRVVPARWPRLGPGAWSADGRWLAVHDDAVGRVQAAVDGEEWLGPPRSMALEAWAADRARGDTVLLAVDTGEVRRLSRRLLAPGWRAPEELVSAHHGLDGQVVLRRADGEALTLPGEARQLVGYADGRALLELAATPGAPSLARWSEGAGLAPAPDPAAAWAVADAEELQRVAVADVARVRLTFERPGGPAGRTVVEARAVLRATLAADAVLAVDDAGLVRVALPGGARTLLVPGAAAARSLPGPRAGEVAVAAVASGAWWVLDGAGATPRRAPLPAGAAPIAVGADGRVLVGPELAVVDASGVARPLLPGP